MLFADPYPYSIDEQKFWISKVMGWQPDSICQLTRKERIKYFERCTRSEEDYWKQWSELLSKLMGG